MKAKVLLVPLVVVIAGGFFIGFVYPAFSNGSNGVLEKYAVLKSEQENLVLLENKSQNVDSLSAQLDSLSEKEILYNFIPENIKEEEIVSSLTNLASSSGVFLYDSTINQPTRESITGDDLKSTTGSKQLSSEILDILPKTKDFKIDIKLFGSYEKIREFLIGLEKINRNNNIDILEISRDTSGGEEASSSGADNLLVDVSIEFNFLKKTKMSNASVSNSVFSSDQLKSDIISEIKEQKNTDSFGINIEQKGKNNLFQK